jgi:hypothetical protein
MVEQMKCRRFLNILGSLLLTGCASTVLAENKTVERVAMSPRLQTLFAKTKLVCFGRYAMEIPEEATLSWRHPPMFPKAIATRVGQASRLREIAERYRTELKERAMPEVTYFGPGATTNSLELRWFNNRYSKQRDPEQVRTLIATGPNLFDWLYDRNGLAPPIRSIRARDDTEIPTSPGFCIDKGFIADASGKYQEALNVKIDLPSFFANFSFEVTSNKFTGLHGASEEERQALTERQETDNWTIDPDIPNLQVRGRQVGPWRGVESLHRREDGAFFLEWQSFSTKPSTLHPSWLNVDMNVQPPDARRASLSGDEAIALWNRLLDSMRFRVNAPPTQTGGR